MEKAGRRGGVRWRWRRRGRGRREPMHLLLRSCPQRPPQLVTHTVTWTDPHTPTQSVGEQESHPLTTSLAPHQHPACPAANGLTGTPSPRRLLPSLPSPAQTPPLPLHLSLRLCTAPATCTETGSFTKVLVLKSHQPATSTHYSTPTSRIWPSNQAGMEEEELLRSIDALGRRRSTASASRR